MTELHRGVYRHGNGTKMKGRIDNDDEYFQ